MEVWNTMYSLHAGNVCTYFVLRALFQEKATKRNPIVHKRHNSKTRSAVVKVTIRHCQYNNYHGSICNRILCKGSSTSCYVIPIVKRLLPFLG